LDLCWIKNCIYSAQAGEQEFGWGAVVNLKRQRPEGESSLEDDSYVVDVLLHVTKVWGIFFGKIAFVENKSCICVPGDCQVTTAL
jgi:hypothetical protein